MLRTRSRPYLVERPLVPFMTPPMGSSMSSPRAKTSGSSPMARSMAWFTASDMVRTGVVRRGGLCLLVAGGHRGTASRSENTSVNNSLAGGRFTRHRRLERRLDRRRDLRFQLASTSSLHRPAPRSSQRRFRPTGSAASACRQLVRVHVLGGRAERVAPQPVGHALEEGGPSPGRARRDRRLGGRAHGGDAVPVDRHRRHAVAGEPPGQAGGPGVVGELGVLPVPVVLADEDDRQLPQRRQVAPPRGWRRCWWRRHRS